MPRVVILGAGAVGSVVAADLCSDTNLQISVADHDSVRLKKITKRTTGRANIVKADLGNPQVIAEMVSHCDLAVGALPGHLGFRALQTVITAGKNICDVSFMAEDARQLHEQAMSAGVTAVVDCGVAPGVSHILAGHAESFLHPCRRIEILVGGLPRHPKPPFLYKAPFSPVDVIEEYTRPARLVENGRVIEREALSEVETVDFTHVGPLEAFNTDGLRSLTHTLSVPSMKEKTLRYPGHVAIMRALKDAGMFSTKPIEIDGVTVRPIDMTTRLLLPQWKFDDGEEDVTVMRVTAEGESKTDGQLTRLQWNLFDTYHAESQTLSMARTTGLPCAIVSRLILSGQINQTGIIFPEQLGSDHDVFTTILDQLKARDIQIQFSQQAGN